MSFRVAARITAPVAICEKRTDLPPTVNLRIDNDLFGKQDQGYSNGVQLPLVSPNLVDYTDAPCLPRRMNRHLDADGNGVIVAERDLLR